jgi:hypothetical protein
VPTAQPPAHAGADPHSANVPAAAAPGWPPAAPAPQENREAVGNAADPSPAQDPPRERIVDGARPEGIAAREQDERDAQEGEDERGSSDHEGELRAGAPGTPRAPG